MAASRSSPTRSRGSHTPAPALIAARSYSPTGSGPMTITLRHEKALSVSSQNRAKSRVTTITRSRSAVATVAASSRWCATAQICQPGWSRRSISTINCLSPWCATATTAQRVPAHAEHSCRETTMAQIVCPTPGDSIRAGNGSALRLPTIRLLQQPQHRGRCGPVRPGSARRAFGGYAPDVFPPFAPR